MATLLCARTRVLICAALVLCLHTSLARAADLPFPDSVAPTPQTRATTAGAPKPDQWIVELDAPPLARYTGGVQGLPATAPRTTGKPLDRDSSAARAYARYLGNRQTAALASAAPGVRPDASYRNAFAGFAAHLTDDQVAALRNAPGVRRVSRERFLQPLAGDQGVPSIAGSEAALLGLPKGLWRRVGGASHAGEGVVVGTIDTGITPEAPSFSDTGFTAPAGWRGTCQDGERFPATSCNNKLIGARFFLAGQGPLPEGFIDSPRDDDGHGTHVAASAVGDPVRPDIGGNDLGVGEITGIAPGAYLAAYKACTGLGCSTVDIISAIDAAVADGVDVLNMSLGGPVDPDDKVDPIQVAALNATAAGVFVAVAAGNDAFDGTINSPGAAPWVTTVAATTGSRTFSATVRAEGGGSAVAIPAMGAAGAVGPAALVDARDLGPRTEDPATDPRYCVGGMTADRVRGKIVICDGSAPPALVASTLVKLGAAGVLYVVPDGVDTLLLNELVPTMFVEDSQARKLRALTGAAPTTASWAAARATPWQPDRVGAFSSRGPDPAAPDLLRPDVAAPGVNTLSAFSPDSFYVHFGVAPPDRYEVISGTSMATPQVAGLAALMRQLHPTWTPGALRSAMVTSGRPAVDTDGMTPAGAMAVGGGRIDPQAANDPGLIVEPTIDDYRRYAEGVDPTAIDGSPEPLAPRDLNMPSIALDRAIAPITVKRTVTSVAPTATTWTATAASDPAADIRIAPHRFRIAPGQRQQITVTLDRALGSARFRDAAILLRDQRSRRVVRVPVAVRNPGVIDQPGAVSLAAGAPDGSETLQATIAGSVSAVGYGLAVPQVDRDLPDHPSSDGQVHDLYKLVHVQADSSLLSAQFTGADDAAQRFVSIYRDADGDGVLSGLDEPVGFPTDPTNTTRVDVLAPRVGDYIIDVNLLADHPATGELRTWLVSDPKPDDPDPAPGLVVDGDPQTAFPGAPRTFTLRWSGASGGEPLRGVIVWRADDAPAGEPALASTVVDLRPGAGATAMTVRPAAPATTPTPMTAWRSRWARAR